MEKPQFSLAALLITVTAVAGVLGLTFQAPIRLAEIALFAVLLVYLSLLTTAAIYGPTRWRPFCIGAAFPLVLLFLWASQSGLNYLFSDLKSRYLSATYQNHNERLLGGGILSSIALGYISLAFHWIVSRNPRD